MDTKQINSIATSMIAFTGFLIGIATIIYYSYQIKENISLSFVITGANLYILINLLFLYIIKERVSK